MSKKDCDELIAALQDMLEIVPDSEALRLYIGSKKVEGPMTPEEFIDFAHVLLSTAKRMREKYD